MPQSEIRQGILHVDDEAVPVSPFTIRLALAMSGMDMRTKGSVPQHVLQQILRLERGASLKALTTALKVA